MKLNYTSKNNRMILQVESESAKDAFKKLAEFQEVFDEASCGLCKSDDLKFVVRTVDSNDYYEMKCNACFAKLAYGQHKAGGSLFPKRKIDGEYNEHKGWHKWNK